VDALGCALNTPHEESFRTVVKRARVVFSARVDRRNLLRPKLDSTKPYDRTTNSQPRTATAPTQSQSIGRKGSISATPRNHLKAKRKGCCGVYFGSATPQHGRNRGVIPHFRANPRQSRRRLSRKEISFRAPGKFPRGTSGFHSLIRQSRPDLSAGSPEPHVARETRRPMISLLDFQRTATASSSEGRSPWGDNNSKSSLDCRRK
jgi:hypothetical protein